jgi:ComF family protein
MKTALYKIYDGITHLLFPQLCEGCSKPLISGEEILCLHCVALLPRTGFHHVAENEAAMRFYGRVPFCNVTSFAYFTEDGLLQHLLHELKYKDKKAIGYFLGKQLGIELLQTEWANTIDVIVPVPLHPKRLTWRGYNQSALIAEGMGEILKVPVAANALKRIKDTESQTQKSRSERVMNVADAFETTTDLSGKHVLLIDDVLTSGATLESAAMAFASQKQVEISIATAALAQ